MQLVIFRVIQGVGLGLFGPAALCLVAQVREKGKGFALCRTANSLGLLLGPIIGGMLGSINLVYPFYLGGFLSLLAIPSVFLIPKGEKLYRRRGKFLASLKGMVLTKKVVLICLAALMIELVFASFDPIIPVLFSSRVLHSEHWHHPLFLLHSLRHIPNTHRNYFRKDK
jgi:MFS family permease